MPRLHSPLNAIDPPLGWINAYVHVHDLSGWPVLLHFWSVNCESCVDQLPELKQLMDRYCPLGLKVVGVHVPLNESDLDTQIIEEQVRQLGLRYPIAVDDASTEHSITLAHDVRAIPAYLVFDREGLLRHYASGAQALHNLESALDHVTAPEEAMVPASPYA